MEQVLLADILSRSAALIVGIFLLIATTVSLLRTVVVPRALRSSISDAVAVTVVWTAIRIARMRRDYLKRDGVLAWTGSIIIIAQLVTWILLYLLAYALLLRGVGGLSFFDAFREAGSSLFTLGFASVSTENQTAIDFLAAATGPVVIALMIGFLPNIYSTYIEREVVVTALSATGGEPAWGPELLSRFALAGSLDALPRVFDEWALWATRLRLTHVTYPVLVWVRSVRATRHYVVSLLAVLDAAALRLALAPNGSRGSDFALLLEGGQAMEVLYTFLFARRRRGSRLGFRGRFTGEPERLQEAVRRLPAWDRSFMAIQVASDMDIVNGLDDAAMHALMKGEDRPLQLTRADFDHAVDVLRRSGFPIERDLDEAWEQFRVARARYEFAAYEVCRRLDATPAPWSGPRNIETPTMWPTLAVDIMPTLDLGQDDAAKDDQ